MKIKILVFSLLFLCINTFLAQIPSQLPTFSDEERDKLTNLRDGMIIFNSSSNCLNYYGKGIWRTLCGQCATPPPDPQILSVTPFYNSISIQLKPDGFQHQLFTFPNFVFRSDTNQLKLISRNEMPDIQQVMMISVNDCGSSQPFLVPNAQYAEKDPCGGQTNLIDSRDNQKYGVFALGNQCWMTANLRYGKADNKTIFESPDGIYRYYLWNFGEVKKNSQTGKFESIPTSQNLCPAGWHIPTEKEANEMINFYHKYATNSFMRNVFQEDIEDSRVYNPIDKSFEPLGDRLVLWTSTPSPYDDTKIALFVVGNEILTQATSKDVSIPIRCIKDKE